MGSPVGAILPSTLTSSTIAAGGAPLWGVYALPVANFGEMLFTVGVLVTILRFSPGRTRLNQGGAHA